MKIWKIEYNKEYSLVERLNKMEKEGKQIREIIYNPNYKEYEIIYTVEDEVEEENE